LIPFHLHINVDNVEAVYLISSMLLEIPILAADPNEANKKIVSKFFRKLLEAYDRSYYTGPPE
jgi:translation initiation factor 3 subunit C